MSPKTPRLSLAGALASTAGAALGAGPALGAAAEQKLTALSSGATETAPSFFKDTIVFGRTNGKRPGTYLAPRWSRSASNAHRGLDVLHADRELADGTSSIASPNIPTLYTGFGGVQAIAPKLRFG